MDEQTRRELDNLASRLDSKSRPGHVDYISKEDAAKWIRALLERESASRAP